MKNVEKENSKKNETFEVPPNYFSFLDFDVQPQFNFPQQPQLQFHFQPPTQQNQPYYQPFQSFQPFYQPYLNFEQTSQEKLIENSLKKLLLGEDTTNTVLTFQEPKVEKVMEEKEEKKTENLTPKKKKKKKVKNFFLIF
jgi:hypothetical protein